jgi:hypothetical protein
VTSKGAITDPGLVSITADNNAKGYGALLNNSSGTGNVSLGNATFASFSNNYLSGLKILSSGSVTTNSTTTSNNGTNGNAGAGGNGHGAYIDNTSSTIYAAVAVAGTNIFSSNYLSGLYILSDGAVLINQTTASFNGTASNNGYGAFIKNTTGPADATAGSVTLTGINTFNNNDLTGLHVVTNGVVAGNSIIASDNGLALSAGIGHGAYIDNTSSMVDAAVGITG